MEDTNCRPALFGRRILSLLSALLFVVSLAACSGGGGGGGASTGEAAPAAGGGGGGGGTVVTLAVSPAAASVTTGLSKPLTANLSGVTWSVNGITGGNAALGTVNASGVYTAPAVKPAPATVTVTATTAGATQSASAQITINDLALSGAGGGYAGTFSAVGNLATARSNHTATLLANGDVLVVGGIGTAGAAIAGSEIYRSTTSDFTSVSAMGTTRAYHTATMLQNGKVLVTGGYDKDNNVLAGAELYDPATTVFSATGSMSVGRVYHSATLLLDGKVLIAGGSTVADLTTGVPLDSIEIYDPATGTFTTPATTVFTDARFSHSALLLNNGKVLLLGGIGLAGQKLATAELYDPASVAGNKIAATGSMTTPRWLTTVTAMSDGTILVVGGSSGTISGDVPSSTYLSSAETYDPLTGIFTVIGSALIDTRGFHTATLLADSTLLITGGYGLLSTSVLTGSSLATAEIFDGAVFAHTNTDMPLERANHTATMLPSSGKVLVVGGAGYSSGSFAVTNSVILYQ